MNSMKSMSFLGELTFLGVLSAAFAVLPMVQAGTLLVDANNAGCSPAGPVYCDIQDAVQAAAAGDVILVSSGTYTPITVTTDNLTIQAIEAGEVVIDPMGVKGLHGVTIDANGVLVRGLIVQNMVRIFDFVNFVSIGGTGFEVNGSDNKLYGNTARGNRQGFVVQGGADSNILAGNAAEGNDVNGFQVSGGSNTLLSNSSLNNNNGYVLSSDTGLLNTFRGNLAEANNSRGFFVVFFPQNNTLESNIARDNGASGFMLLFGANANILRGNRAEGNGTAMQSDDNFGFVVARESDGNVLQGNIAKANSGEGFAMADCNDNLLEANLSQGNGEGGFGLADDVTATFGGGGTSYNSFIRNIARDNGGDGFYVLNGAAKEIDPTDPTDFNLFQNNSSIQNAGWGYFVETPLSNIFENNNCQLNDLGGATPSEICH